MMGAKVRYLELRWELLLEREVGGGNLPMNREAEYASELDRCWIEMATEEQDEVEEAIAAETAPQAPAEFSFVDVTLDIGMSEQPRRAA